MSDFSIPGTSSSKYNTQELIEKLMEAERIPLTRMEEKVDQLEQKRDVWQGINRRIVELRASARLLWSYENPFNDRIANSSDESVLTAAATREAVEEELEFTVLQVASGDKYVSGSIGNDFQVPEGNYRFVIGDKEINIRYHGGRIKNFVDTINEKAKDYLRANLIRNTADTYVFTIEGLKTGAENRIFFDEAAVDLGIKTGMLKEAVGNQTEISLSQDKLRPWNTASIDPNDVYVSDGKLVVEPGNEVRIPFPSTVKLEENFILEYDIDVKNTLGEYSEPQPPPGPDEPALDPLHFEGLTIYGESSIIELPDWKPPEKPPFVSDLHVLYAESGGSLVSLPQVEDTDGPQKKEFNIGAVINSIDALNIRNRNSDRTITISNIRIYNPASTGEYEPNNLVSSAADAKILIDGIEVTRSSNIIDDLVPGVTLTLKKADDEPVNLKIEPDREAVKDGLIKLVYDYNSLLEDIQILTNNDENVIDEIFHFSDEEREEKKEILGVFQGDITFMQMKSQLQRIMMNPYQTSEYEEINMLAQLGISTNSTGGVFDSSKLRGYLEINEEVLDQVLASKMPLIKELFGYDSNQDLTIDTGVGYTLDNYLNQYVQTGGLIATRINTLESDLKRTNEEIERFELKLEDKEAQLRREYGVMEGTLNELESQQNSLNGFFNSNNNQ